MKWLKENILIVVLLLISFLTMGAVCQVYFRPPCLGGVVYFERSLTPKLTRGGDIIQCEEGE